MPTYLKIDDGFMKLNPCWSVPSMFHVDREKRIKESDVTTITEMDSIISSAEIFDDQKVEALKVYAIIGYKIMTKKSMFLRHLFRKMGRY